MRSKGRQRNEICPTIWLIRGMLAGLVVLAYAYGGGRTEHLRTEYLVNRLGIDVQKPRLTWVLPSSPRGRMQSAWQVLVASNPKSLAQNQGDLWDSRKVMDKQLKSAVFQGKPLVSGKRCYWKMRYRDEAGKVSPWSEAALFSMGYRIMVYSGA